MSATEDKNQPANFTRIQLIAFQWLGVHKMKNQTDAQIKTPFSDHPYSVIVFSLSASIENLTGKKSKPRWWPFFFIDSKQFYSSTLDAGESMLLIHGRKIKSAGYLSSDVNSNQASYVYTYTHENDPHQKAFDSEPKEVEKCVI